MYLAHHSVYRLLVWQQLRQLSLRRTLNLSRICPNQDFHAIA